MLHGSPPNRWHHLGLGSFTVIGVICVVGTFLPWLHSGTRWRSSYDLLGLVDRLGFAPNGPIELLVRGWPVVPMLVVAALVLVWWRRTVLGLVVALVAALYIGGVSIAMTIAASDVPIDVGVGPLVCSVASTALLVNAVVLQATVRLRPEACAEAPVPSPHADPH